MKHRGLPLAALVLAAALSACPHDSDGGNNEPDSPPVIKTLTLSQVSGENSFTAAWELESDSPPEGTSYELLYNETGTAPAAEASGLPAATTETKVSDLGGGKTYTAWVRAILAEQKGLWSEPAAITLKKDQTALTFSIEVFGQTRFAQVQGDTLHIRVPINTPKPWRFTPQIALSEGASLVSSPGAGEEADFSDPENPVHYRVEAENGRIQDYAAQMQTGDESGLGFTLEPEQDLLSLDSPLVLSQNAGQTKALIVGTEYQNCTWYVDGILKTRNNSLRLQATDYRPGVHYLSVSGYIGYTDEAEDRVPWSTELMFTVID